MPFVTTSEMARRITAATGCEVRPSWITDLFYKRLIRDDDAPIMSGRRLIPLDLEWLITSKLKERGQLVVAR